MIKLKQVLAERSLFGDRPLAIMPLIAVLATLFILTTMLGTMVWGRVSLLQNGTQVVLKTAPVDPRDLLRGYFARLNYDISRLKLNDLAGWNKNRVVTLEHDGFKRHNMVYVELRQQTDGFWSPYWVHRAMPQDGQGHVYIRGRVRSNSCRKRLNTTKHCTLSLRYGIEKYFTDKTGAKKLEDFGRRTSPEITELRQQISELRKTRGRPQDSQNGVTKPMTKEARKQLARMQKQLSKLIEKNRLDMANRFAVTARIDKQSGEAAISGLQLDGKAIYEEPLF